MPISSRDESLGSGSAPGAEVPDGEAVGLAAPPWPLAERRTGRDRRDRPTRWYDSLLGHRRRARGRRADESRNIYVDVYLLGDLILVALIFGLNVLDAAFTLYHLAHGAVEQNPLMDQLIQWGHIWFLIEKIFVIALCMGALLIHKTFQLAHKAALVLLTAYGLLMIQHMALL